MDTVLNLWSLLCNIEVVGWWWLSAGLIIRWFFLAQQKDKFTGLRFVLPGTVRYMNVMANGQGP